MHRLRMPYGTPTRPLTMSPTRLPSPFDAARTLLAELLEYPGPDTTPEVERTRVALETCARDAIPSFDRFARVFLDLTPDAREELHAATFDINPACVPYVSIHLFGEENFKRGEFMARLGARYQELQFDAGIELADHLAILLRFLTIVEEEERRELLHFCLLAPLARMAGSLKDENPYAALLQTIQLFLKAEFPGLEAAPLPADQMRQGMAAGCSALSTACGCGAGAPHVTEASRPVEPEKLIQTPS